MIGLKAKKEGAGKSGMTNERKVGMMMSTTCRGVVAG